jgi:hypothetical protein
MPVCIPPPSTTSIALDPVEMVGIALIQQVILLHFLLMNLYAKEPFYSSHDFFNRKVIN